MKSVGYFFWGYLGDEKSDEKGKQTTSPDGNAFYSWSIIAALKKRGFSVNNLSVDRDAPLYNKVGPELFKAWCWRERNDAYLTPRNMLKDLTYAQIAYLIESSEDIEVVARNLLQANYQYLIKNMEFALIEWRWRIPGRNVNSPITSSEFTPDFLLQSFWIAYLKKHNIPVVVFDLDYKLTQDDIDSYGIEYVVELGNKWEKLAQDGLTHVKARKVFIPFDFSCINEFSVEETKQHVVYVGNDYEREWCVNKYLPAGTTVYGKWATETQRLHQDLQFMGRINAAQMHDAYKNFAVTPLLAKAEYCKYSFVTARLIEAIFYGVVPLFIRELGDGDPEFFNRFIPVGYHKMLIVDGADEVVENAQSFSHIAAKKSAIEAMREHLSFMDAQNFVSDILLMLH